MIRKPVSKGEKHISKWIYSRKSAVKVMMKVVNSVQFSYSTTSDARKSWCESELHEKEVIGPSVGLRVVYKKC